MNRRSAIRTVLITSAGIALLPACSSHDTGDPVALSKIKISGEQALLLASLTAAVIPTTDTPGAKEAKADQFILKMVNDCAAPDEQKKFSEGLAAFQKWSSSKFNKSFDRLTDGQRKQMLGELESKKDIPAPVADFYDGIKGGTIQCYTGSEYYMTNVMDYNIIPKHYKGCVPVGGA